jgi:signal transduction histidine kinase
MTTLRTVIAYLATMIRCTGIAYIIVQVAIWHSFYTAHSWRFTAPALAVAWALGVTVYLRKHWPAAVLTGADSAAYLVLALTAQACVPPEVRDSPLSWLVIAMSGQIIVPAWYASGALSVPLALSSPVAYLIGAKLQPVTDPRMMTGAAVLLLVVGLVHGWGRRVLYGRAASADADLDRADQAARKRYAGLRRNIERREHERLLHDTILNTLTAVARGSGDAVAVAEVVTRCRQDVALMEAALGGADDPAADSGRPAGGLLREVRGVVTDMRARGLTVHLEVDEAGEADKAGEADEAGEAGDGSEAEAAIPAGVSTAISNAVREALSNVAEHAGTGEAWVSVRRTAPGREAGNQGRLRVAVRDQGTGFDLALVDQARLGLRRSITERVAEYGGQASVRSEPGQGTEVSFSWPAPDQAGGYANGDYPAGRELVREALPW